MNVFYLSGNKYLISIFFKAINYKKLRKNKRIIKEAPDLERRINVYKFFSTLFKGKYR